MFGMVQKKKNQALKEWAPADPDADMWRSLVRNDDKLHVLWKGLLSTMGTKDVKSQQNHEYRMTMTLFSGVQDFALFFLITGSQL